MAEFRLLHLSDSHLCRVPNRKNWIVNLLDRKSDTLFGKNNVHSWHFSSYRPAASIQCARFAYNERRYLDFIVCTGDLATTGDISDLDVARQYFTQPSAKKYAHDITLGAMAGSGKPIVLMPGNHDRYRKLGIPGNGNFDLVFGAPHWNVKNSARIGVSRFAKGETHVCVLTADFCLRRKSDMLRHPPLGYLGQGHTYADTLACLVSETDKARQQHNPTVVIWAVHFPPVGNVSEKMRLIDGDKLLRSAKDNGIQLIMCGHLHEKNNHRNSAFLVTGVTSCCAVDVDGSFGMQVLEMTIKGTEISSIVRKEIDWSNRIFAESRVDKYVF